MEMMFIKKFFPEFIEKYNIRYKILNYIYFNYPVGRRMISNSLDISERIVRSEIDKLIDLGLIEVIKSGAIITDFGIKVLEEGGDLFNKFNYTEELENKLKEYLKIRKVIICNDISGEETSIKNMTKIASKYFFDRLSENYVVGISGGTTMKSFVDNLNVKNNLSNLTVVPARGSISTGLEYQSNVVADNLSKKLNAKLYGTFLPDYLDKTTFDKLKTLDEIKNLIYYLERIDILVFGIGRSDEMAKRRALSHEELEILRKNKAVSEAFGNYFDINGNVVYSSNTIGLDMEKYLNIKEVIAVAGYGSKEKSIVSICKIRSDMTLITSESTAKKILKL